MICVGETDRGGQDHTVYDDRDRENEAEEETVVEIEDILHSVIEALIVVIIINTEQIVRMDIMAAMDRMMHRRHIIESNDDRGHGVFDEVPDEVPDAVAVDRDHQ